MRIANKAKNELANIIFKKTFSEINKKIRIGHMGFHIDLTDLSLEGLDDDFRSIFQQTFDKLKELGYSVAENNLDNNGFTVEIPKTPPQPKVGLDLHLLIFQCLFVLFDYFQSPLIVRRGCRYRVTS